MRDPATTIDDPLVVAAIQETRNVLSTLQLWGALRDGAESHPDLEMRAKALKALHLERVVDKKLPDDVRRYLRRLVCGESKTLPKRGRPRNAFRDQMLVEMIEHIQLRYGINPTRNRETYDRYSGCDIVSQSLGELGIKLKYEGVEEVWRARTSRRNRRINQGRKSRRVAQK
jgi:hypothetical protein